MRKRPGCSVPGLFFFRTFLWSDCFKNMKRFLLFLLINFSALWLGSFLMGNPQTNGWYQQMHKAPWTPPGWFFGVAWFTIMSLFSWFLTRNFKWDTSPWRFLYSVHLLLNIFWNPVFFQLHWVLTAFGILLLLVITVLWFFRLGKKPVDKIVLLPYALWLLVAGSLNLYIFWMN